MNILPEILAHKRTEIAALDAEALRRGAESSPTPRDFITALALPTGEQRVKLIAELKRASPSKGVLAPKLDLLDVAEIYADNGAAAISVLTDQKFFGGSLETLKVLRFERRMRLPLLRKDFIIDAVQLYETRANGADAVLLIAAALPDDHQLADLHSLALDLGLTPLVEVHDEVETARVLRLNGLRLIGINNRNLATFEVALEITERLRPMIPSNIVLVAESGVFTAGDVERLSRANVDAVLVGEALITANDIGAKVRELAAVASPLPHPPLAPPVRAASPTGRDGLRGTAQHPPHRSCREHDGARRQIPFGDLGRGTGRGPARNDKGRL